MTCIGAHHPRHTHRRQYFDLDLLTLISSCFNNAFPWVNQPTLWSKLLQRGASGPLIDWFRLLYSQLRYTVPYNNEDLDVFRAGQAAGVLTVGDPTRGSSSSRTRISKRGLAQLPRQHGSLWSDVQHALKAPPVHITVDWFEGPTVSRAPYPALAQWHYRFKAPWLPLLHVPTPAPPLGNRVRTIASWRPYLNTKRAPLRSAITRLHQSTGLVLRYYDTGSTVSPESDEYVAIAATTVAWRERRMCCFTDSIRHPIPPATREP